MTDTALKPVAHRQSPDGLVLKATLLFTSTLTVSNRSQ